MRICDLVAEGRLPLEVVWAASIEIHSRQGHIEPWEICTQGCGEHIAGPVVLEALRQLEATEQNTSENEVLDV